MENEKTNIADYLPEVARLYGNRRAVVYPHSRDRLGRVSYTHLTFSQLNDLSNQYAREFHEKGIKKGTLTLMFLKPGLDFIAAVFAIFKTGAVPVLIDPGMGRKNLLNCIRNTKPEAMVAISPLHWLKHLFPSVFKTVKLSFSFGRLAAPGTFRMEDALQQKPTFEIERTALSDTAAILFTTGSTGPPKGVVYTHKIFITQTELIRKTYGAGPGEIDLPGFPLFALFSSALGMTCVIPDMDPSRPAQVNPERIVEAILNQNVSFSFGSPALWLRVADYCLEHDISLTGLKRVLMAGAPVSAQLHGKMKKIISSDGEVMVPYGATESLPIATFTGSEMLNETAHLSAEGKGYCVGYPLPGITIKIIEPVDVPIAHWRDTTVLKPNEIGEIVVKGSVVTPAYYNLERHTEMAKINDDDGFWHRMGDVGFFDEKGRLWFCGRKAHRVVSPGRIFYSVCSEAIFNQHEKVFRSALVGIPEDGHSKPVMIVEPEDGCYPRGKSEQEAFVEELKELGKQHDFTAHIAHFLFHPSFPVDIRHNAKIFREQLSTWAVKEINSRKV